MTLSDYADYDGLGLAELVRKGEVSAAELVEDAIARVEKHNPALNAVIHPMFEQARADAADQPKPGEGGPFQGVPFVVKDLLANYAGVPNTSGSRLLEGAISPFDAELVTRYKAAGLIAVGKTNSPEFGIVPTTEPLFYGPTRNPWNTDHSTGGSSGGSAAAVAAGIVPIGHANDGGGSIRIPASCCGLVGLKPTRARNPLGPVLGDALGGMVAEHVVTRSVRDTAAVLDCTAGPAPGDPYAAPPVERPFLEEVTRDPGSLRIGFWTRGLGDKPVHAECIAATENTARLCEELGHTVVEANPAYSAEALAEAFMQVWAAGLVASADMGALAVGRTPSPELVEPLTWALYEQGKQVTAAQYQLAIGSLQLAARQIAAFFEEYDVWLTPTLGAPPLEIGVVDVNSTDADAAFAPIMDYCPFTPTFNATGQPAISLPLHWSADGLPVGVHFAGRFGDEGGLLRLAAQLEGARPWSERRPPIFG